MTNTNTRIHRLAAGQALAVDGKRNRATVLVEGEVMVQEPARWLANTFVVEAPRRVEAPARLPAGTSCAVVALSGSTILVEEEAGLAAMLKSAWAGLVATGGRRGTAAAH